MSSPGPRVLDDRARPTHAVGRARAGRPTRTGRPLARRLPTLLVAAATAMTSMMGCTAMQEKKGLSYTPEVRGVDEARTATKRVSSDLLDMTGVKAKVTEPGPGVAYCEDEPDRKDLYVLRHPWSLYGVPKETLEEGMRRLHEELPRKGWKILKDGKDSSPNQNWNILAENQQLRHSADITLMRRDAGKQPLLSVVVVSACFQAPEGTDLGKEY
ncbi:hypothetical protein [Streptomyces sp. URMC 123]|uniref:hypothetical protein n=1 Tax=Streptomyces sp. URMC 123 TaxID=3423403 RepID=UPI003F1CDDC0